MHKNYGGDKSLAIATDQAIIDERPPERSGEALARTSLRSLKDQTVSPTVCVRCIEQP